jgi:hypothetical protein
MDCPAWCPLLIARTVPESVQADSRHMFLSNTLESRCCTSHSRAISDSDVMWRNSVKWKWIFGAGVSFCPFIVPRHVNHTASERNTSLHIWLFSSPEPPEPPPPRITVLQTLLVCELSRGFLFLLQNVWRYFYPDTLRKSRQTNLHCWTEYFAHTRQPPVVMTHNTLVPPPQVTLLIRGKCGPITSWK